jgi:hypothetical protein
MIVDDTYRFEITAELKNRGPYDIDDELVQEDIERALQEVGKKALAEFDLEVVYVVLNVEVV